MLKIYIAYNKMEVMYGRLHINVEVEWGSPFMFMRGFSYILPLLFLHTWNLCVYSCNRNTTLEIHPKRVPMRWSDVVRFMFVETNTPSVSSLAVCHHGAPLLPPVKRRIPGNIGNSFVSFYFVIVGFWPACKYSCFSLLQTILCFFLWERRLPLASQIPFW